MTADQLVTALVLSIPANQSLWSFDFLGAAATNSSDGVATLKQSTEVANLVTSAANLLTNDTTVYASYAIIMNQAIAKKVGLASSMYSSRQLPAFLEQRAHLLAPQFLSSVRKMLPQILCPPRHWQPAAFAYALP